MAARLLSVMWQKKRPDFDFTREVYVVAPHHRQKCATLCPLYLRFMSALRPFCARSIMSDLCLCPLCVSPISRLYIRSSLRSTPCVLPAPS